ncbi:ABC transporter substrate-binding protein [Zavarzinella formosa]|uniref:ABC transporter substrate-binding protein n=1 Tax=Zavarzinella formosa TaxID=360055 RepID=UPI0002FF9141|nr:extracellular solute-binding protein [Zavarzinella formosa]
MQQNPPETSRVFARPQIFAPVFILMLLALGGCADRPSTIDVSPERPYENLTLRVAASDSSDLPILRDLARSWANRHHATVIVSDILDDEKADLFLISPAELPRMAEAGKLAELPGEYLVPTHPYRWDDIFIVNSSRLCGWKNKTHAVPVIGEGMVLAYRTDHFTGKNGQPGTPPRTWDELLRQAAVAPNKGMASWPATAEAREALFFSLAASFDKLAINRLPSGTMVHDDFFSFHFDPATGKSRLGDPAFLEAGKVMQQLTPLMTSGADPVESFNKHGATFGFATLRDLARLDSEVAGRIGILPLPGVTRTIDKGESKLVPGGNINRVPYLGWGGRIGVVSAKYDRPDAAWNFWTDAGMPDHQSLDLIAATNWGAGPYRASQIEARVRPRWLGYQLTTSETDRLTGSLRDNLGLGAQNYRTRLRTPNERELRMVLRPHLEGIISGKEPADQAIKASDEEWKAIIGKIPPEQWRGWVRKSLGLSAE